MVLKNGYTSEYDNIPVKILKKITHKKKVRAKITFHI